MARPSPPGVAFDFARFFDFPEVVRTSTERSASHIGVGVASPPPVRALCQPLIEQRQRLAIGSGSLPASRVEAGVFVLLLIV